MLVVETKYDTAIAERICLLEWPEIEPYLPSMLGWCIDQNWPVARVFAERCVELGEKCTTEFEASCRAMMSGFVGDKRVNPDFDGIYNLLWIVDRWPNNVVIQIQQLLHDIAHAQNVREVDDEVRGRAAYLLMKCGAPAVEAELSFRSELVGRFPRY